MMVAVDQIGEGSDYNPIGTELSPDANTADFNAWESQLRQGAPDDFVTNIIPAFQSLPVWFESPATTASIAYQTTVNYVATFENPHDAGNFHNVVMLYSKDPAWQLHLVSAYVARMVRAQDSRTSLMHGVMRRTIDILRATAQAAVNSLQGQVNANSRGILNEANARTKGDRATLDAANRNIVKAADSAAKTANAWALTHIAKPLQHQADVDRANTVQAIHDTRTYADGVATLKAAAAVAPVALAVAALQRQVGQLQTMNDTCVEPMCETMGPATDLGKLLKSISWAKWLALLAFLETVDIKEFEHIAVLAAGTEGEVGAWIASHILDELEAQ